VVHHYAGAVCYDSEGFCARNKDAIMQEAVDMIRSSTNQVLKNFLLCDDLEAAGGGAAEKINNGKAGAKNGKARNGAKAKASPKNKRISSITQSTVGSQFKTQLNELVSGLQVVVGVLRLTCLFHFLHLERNHQMATIRATHPHYVRCIKPNDLNTQGQLWRVRVVEQLRCGGVLEAVRVARAGYPTRLTHSEFVLRYRMLETDLARSAELAKAAKQGERESSVLAAPSRNKGGKSKSGGAKVGCLELQGKSLLISILALIGSDFGLTEVIDRAEGKAADELFEAQCVTVGVQFGVTKVFFRRAAYEACEAQRTVKLTEAAVKTQASIRSWIRRRAYAQMKRSCLVLQCAVRCALARRHLCFRRETNAAIVVQARLRGHCHAASFGRLQRGCIALQSLHRASLARYRVKNIHREFAVIKMQAALRRAAARASFAVAKCAIVLIQTMKRGRDARDKRRSLFREMRDVGALSSTIGYLKSQLAEQQRQVDEEKKRAKGAIEERERKLALEMQASEGTLAEKMREREDELEAAVQTKEQEHSAAMDAKQAEMGVVAQLAAEEHATVLKMAEIVKKQEEQIAQLTRQLKEQAASHEVDAANDGSCAGEGKCTVM
jgi:myosin-5